MRVTVKFMRNKIRGVLNTITRWDIKRQKDHTVPLMPASETCDVLEDLEAKIARNQPPFKPQYSPAHPPKTNAWEDRQMERGGVQRAQPPSHRIQAAPGSSHPSSYKPPPPQYMPGKENINDKSDFCTLINRVNKLDNSISPLNVKP
ncbi:hypothetical protein JTB14_015501 [Gonioctena quinquepunctata]|nr:hypothetical protein JTB14_015501 [Gonioctena quinquepunctata]